jgi:hypothetical protein
MVASKDIRNYIGSGQSPTSSLRDSLSACFSVECSEVLTMGYARREKEVGEWRGTARMKSQESVPLKGSPGVTPDFKNKIECMIYVCQDQNSYIYIRHHSIKIKVYYIIEILLQKKTRGSERKI